MLQIARRSPVSLRLKTSGLPKPNIKYISTDQGPKPRIDCRHSAAAQSGMLRSRLKLNSLEMSREANCLMKTAFWLLSPHWRNTASSIRSIATGVIDPHAIPNRAHMTEAALYDSCWPTIIRQTV